MERTLSERWSPVFLRRRASLGVGLAAGVLLAGAACYPGGDDFGVEDYDVVLTTHDEAADFGAYQTYAMPDSVIHLLEEGEDAVVLSREYDDLILDLASDNMESLGYVREADPAANGADVILLVGAVGTSETQYWWADWWYNWGYWGGWGYYPGWGPGWGWGYPPGYVGSVEFEEGTLLLTLVDPAMASSTEQEVPVVWAGAVRGLLTGGAAAARITSGINEAFAQSPYLGS
jgi:hypothetical protein